MDGDRKVIIVVTVHSIENKKIFVATLSVVSNSILVISKIAVGITMGSVSVISEAIHSGIDLLASVIALFAVKKSNKPPDKEHPFGHGKFENVSGTVEAILIFFAALWIIYEAIHKFINPQPLKETSLGIAVMLFSAITNIVVSHMLFKVSKQSNSIALEADAWHLRTDVYTSIGVMIGLVAIFFLEKFYPTNNFAWIDPVAAIFVSLLIIKTAYELTVKAGKDLFDVQLPKEELEQIKSTINSLLVLHPEIKGYRNIKTRKAGNTRFIELNLILNSKLSLEESYRLRTIVNDILKEVFVGANINICTEPEKMPQAVQRQNRYFY
ncbi:MAG: cation transporter [Oligoflexia bacterium]|nr:cation transporter [Oligoflexia bacterium]